MHTMTSRTSNERQLKAADVMHADELTLNWHYRTLRSVTKEFQRRLLTEVSVYLSAIV